MHNRRSVIVLLVVLLIVLNREVVYGAPTASQAASALSLAVTLQPLPADGGTYPSLVVTVNDASGNPAMTLSDTTIFFSSSQETVATVPPSVVLPGGHDYVIVNVTTTQKQGTTMITAASSGLKSATVNFKTASAGQNPTQLVLSVSPSKTLQSFVGYDALVAVQLLNASSFPAYSNNSAQIVITSSNATVVENTARVTIPPRESYAYFPIKAKSSGVTTFTALSGGLTSSSASVSIQPLPFALSVTASPNPLLANATAQVTVVVGLAGRALPNAIVTFASNVGTVTPTKSATDEAGRALATFTSRNPGVATVMASIDHPYVGERNASVAIVITQPTPPVVQSPFQVVYSLVPVILAVVFIAVLAVAIRRALRRRTAFMKEEGAEQ